MVPKPAVAAVANGDVSCVPRLVAVAVTVELAGIDRPPIVNDLLLVVMTTFIAPRNVLPCGKSGPEAGVANTSTRYVPLALVRVPV